MKTTFSKIAIMAVALTIGTAASAEYLYAFIGDQEGNGVRDYSGTGYVQFDYATFSLARGSTDYLKVNDVGTAVASDGTKTRTATNFYIGDEDTTFNTFVVELWLKGNGSAVAWQEYSRTQFDNSIIAEKGGGSGEPFYITSVIPEPSSALLLLFGLAGLAVRRRKVVVSMLALAFAAATFAAQNDLLISFSTKGPDTYADDSIVMDGECYALVWTPDKVASAAIAADGTAVNGAEIVLVAPVAKNGKCPNVVYRIDAKRVESEFANGSWSVYLLDTRKYSYAKDGSSVVTLAGLKNDGSVKLVNATSIVGDAALKAASGDNVSLSASVATSAAIGTELPADVPKPTIAGIEVKGGNVYVTIENAVPYLAYDLTTGDTPDAVTESVDRPCTGSDDGTVVLVAPAKEGGAFFKVGRDEEGRSLLIQ